MSDTKRVPIMSLGRTVVVALPEDFASEDAVLELQSGVSHAIQTEDATSLVIDLSGVRFLDSYLTRVIRDVALSAKLTGVRTALCGIRPSIAITLVEMDLTLPGVKTALKLEHALRMLRDHSHETDELDDPDEDEAPPDAAQKRTARDRTVD
jgi:rsbT antagonist protein RsbS